MPFFIELSDSFGNTSMGYAVVEAEIEVKNGGQEKLHFKGPDNLVEKHCSCYRDTYFGWAEADGPARMLTYMEWKRITSDLSEEAKANAMGKLYLLKAGGRIKLTTIKYIMQMLSELIEKDKSLFVTLVKLARDVNSQLEEPAKEALISSGFINPDGKMLSKIISVVLSAVEGDNPDIKLVDPIAS